MAVTVTIADIRTNFPEFSDTTEYSDLAIQFSIDLALLWMSGMTALQDNWAQKLALLLSAQFVVFKKQGETGDPDNISPLSSISLGPASKSYQSTEAKSVLQATLEATLYGQQFNELLTVWRLQNKIAINLNG